MIAAFAVVLSILVGFDEATERLDTAVEAVSPIVAALIPFGALFGAVFLCGLLAGMGYVYVVDRRDNGPEKRKFESLHDELAEARKKLEESMSGHDPAYPEELYAQYRGRLEEADALVESLAGELKQIGIATPPVGNIHSSDKVEKWLKTLPRLAGFSSRGDLDAAIRFGDSWRSDSEEDADA